MGGDGPWLSGHWSLPDYCRQGAQTNRPPQGEQMTPGVKTILSYCKWEPLQVHVVSPDQAMLSVVSLLLPLQLISKICNFNIMLSFLMTHLSSLL